MIFWRKKVCQIVIDKRKPIICKHFSASTVLIFDCSASHLLGIAFFSLIGRVAQNHTSTPTAKLLLPWHLCYEACLPTSSIPSQAFFLSVSPSDFNFVGKFPPIFCQVKPTFYQVIYHLVTSPWSAELKNCCVQWCSAFTGTHSSLIQLCCYSYTRCKNFSYHRLWI